MSYFYNVIENADVATFDDAVDGSMINSALFSIDHVQDLNGYGYPWPAGGGKNKLPLLDLAGMQDANTTGTWSNGVFTSSAGLTYTPSFVNGVCVGIKVNGTATSNFNFVVANNYSNYNGMVLNGCPAGGGTGSYYLRFTSGSQNINDIGSGTAITVDTSSYHTLAIRIIGGSVINDLTFYPMISAEGGDFAPYANICPISGWNGATITRLGGNWYDKSTVTTSGRDKRISTSNGSTYSSTGSTATAYVPIIGGQTYTLTTGRTAYAAWYDKNKTFIAGSNWGNGASKTFPENAAFFKFDYATANEDNVMLNLGSTALPFAPYTSTTTALDWSDHGTIYGGYVDITNGSLVITHANIASYDDEDINEPWISSMDAFTPGATPTIGAQVVYTLKPPIEISIPAVPIEVLNGVNNIWSDNLTIKELIYRIDNANFYRRYDYIMNNPGYYLLDGGGIDLSSSSSQSITGSWQRTVTAIKTNKPIFAYNTKYGSGKPLTPVPVFCWYITETQAVIVGATLHIIVNSDDSCVVQDVATANRSLGAIERAAAEIPASEESTAEEPAAEISHDEETSNNE